MTAISVITPVYNTPVDVLDAAIESVVRQDFPHWELCIVDDASTDLGTRKALRRWAKTDSRIHVTTRETNGGIAAASNDALAMATGAIVALLDHDDLLAVEALGALNHAFVQNPGADVVYTDEDKIDGDGNHLDPFFKPAWSPEYLLGCMYIGHLTAYRTSLVRVVGGFREEFSGSQDWDLALRVTQRARQVVHVPRVLYHWRILTGSAAADTEAKPYALSAGKRAVAEFLHDRGVEHELEDAPVPGWLVVRRQLPEAHRVTVVIPTAGSVRSDGAIDYRLIDRCLDGVLHKTDYDDIDVVVVISSNAPHGLEDELPELHGERVRTVRLNEPFNYSTSINSGVLQSSGEFVLLLNDDTEVLDPSWLQRLVSIAADPEVGLVGAKLLFPDGTIQHAGVVHDPSGYPHHEAMGVADGIGYFGDLHLTMNYLAVTGACQVMRREVFHEVGGYDPEFPLNYNDIDFSLRVIAAGYRVVQENSAVLVHHESVSRKRGVHTSEMELFLERWGHQTPIDPFRRSIPRAR